MILSVKSDILEIHSITIYTNMREVYKNKQLVELTPREYDLLLYLVTHQKYGTWIVNKSLNEVWGFDYFGDTNVVDVYIRYLRKKLMDSEGRAFDSDCSRCRIYD